MKKKLIEALREIKLPYAYFEFAKDENIKPPFIVYLGNGAEVFEADFGYFTKKYKFSLEFYFDHKDFEMEERIESILEKHGFKWEKSEDLFIKSEQMFEIIYYI